MPELANVYEVLDSRGFVAQSTDPEAIKEHLEQPRTCYIGFDPTADSLHIGSLVPILALVHMQRHGHRPIVLVGGGTGLVGDPSGKTEMRKLLDIKQIEGNVAALKKQLSQFLDFSAGRALLVNNAEWLLSLGYIEFLRDIGKHFSVNRMLAAESYKLRLETGLNFIEFNYMLLQAYDFYYLAKHYDCFVQMGGNDQWGNIVAGIDLIRRKKKDIAFGITFPLTTTASGAKMGKTASGAIWLSSEKTSPFDFFQYWVNTDDRDVERFLKLYTFLPLEEVERVQGLEGQELNACKTILAYEVTALTHGVRQARAAYEGATGVFGQRLLPQDLLPSSTIPRTIEQKVEAVPTTLLSRERLRDGIPAFQLFFEVGLCSSRSAARRLIQQGGAYVNDERVRQFDAPVGAAHLTEEGIMLKAGKKKIHCVRSA
ncbi:tyrosine--tRNA ligase [Syntrophobacteraceae bacterium DRH4]|nr:tyrosine--tRNA ligase [Desulfoferrobacter suflitae]MCK8601142.1 tyrosine--tRNA ligase [Desulfoferrobacter suflitae]